METESLTQLIKKALTQYDNQCLKYLEILKVDHENVRFNITNTEITFTLDSGEEKIYDFEILGYFDYQNKVWIWGWLLTNLGSDQTKICRELLEYGLKLEPNSNSTEHFYIKTLLVNSRISIEEDIQLDTNLAICSYLSKNKILFIYPRRRYLDNTKTNYVTFYYLIK